MSETHRFQIPLMPDRVPAELLALPSETRVEYTTGVQGRSGRTTAEAVIDLFEDRITRRRCGRYSLREAAAIIEAETGEYYSRMIEDLAIAAVSGELRVHERDRNATYRATEISTHAAKSLDSTASQLNAWLTEKHPLISFRFQDPALAEPSCSAQPAGDFRGVGADEAPVCEGSQRKHTVAGGESKNGMTRRWTPEFTAEVQAYRDQHGTNAAANHFKVSTTVIKNKTKTKRAAHEASSNPALSILTTGFTDRRR